MPSSRQRARSPALAAGGQHHDRRRGIAPGCCLMLLGHVEAVHVRHVGVEQHQAETARPCGGPFAAAARAAAPLSTTMGRIRQLQEHLVEDAAVGGVVVHDQHRQPVQPSRLGSGRLRPWPAAARSKRRGEVERAALARLALDPDPAAHQLDQLRARSPGPGRCRRICRVVEPSAWAKASKIARLLVGGMPMPVSRTVKCSRTVVAGVVAPRVCDARRRPRRCSVNLMALPTRLMRICRSRPGSPTQSVGHVRRRCGRPAPGPSAGARRASVLQRVAQAVAQVELGRRPARACRPRSWRNRGCR